LLCAAPAAAQRANTREALSRAEETLSVRIEEGVLKRNEVTPAIVVSTSARYQESETWFATAALSSIQRALGAGSLRACEACMAPRVHVQQGRLEHNYVAPTMEEIARLDEQHRGRDPPAKAAIWLDETADGVSLRIIAMGTSRILYAENFDSRMREQERSAENFTVAQELERRQRGESLVHTFIDFGLLPGQHVSGDWVEQFGEQNENLVGPTISLFDPFVGIGGAYYRVIPQAFGIAVGAKAIVSVPTALVSAAAGDTTNVIDPLLTGVAVVRIPIFDTNYGVLLTASTNGRFTAGISLLNISLLPVLP
jgi:hypothetical protein